MEIPAHPETASVATYRRRYTRAARDGFEALLRELGPETGRPVLLPAYVGWSPREGSGLFDPVEATGTAHAFYPLDDRLRVDGDALARLVEEREPAAVVVVHYFGVPEPATPGIAELCRERDVVLIEDCAHCLGARLGGRPVGEIGDYALVSLHKVLACPAGGFLQAGPGRPLPEAVPRSAAIAPGDLAVFASTDVDALVRRRRFNYLRLLERVADVPGVRPFHDGLEEGSVPLNLPVLVEGADRFEVYKRMRARGIGVVALYHTLIDALDRDAFPGAFRLSSRILNLPIHQELGPAELDLIAEALGEALAEEGA